ncbi:hypothetical protein MMC12_008732 [Toensbergia leucococca]|nr:hypothetical protein [Toensbergia leucococca]
MPTIDVSLVAREANKHSLIRRNNWAGKNPGVILVFCIVFIVAAGLIGLFLYRKALARKAKRQTTLG